MKIGLNSRSSCKSNQCNYRFDFIGRKAVARIYKIIPLICLLLNFLVGQRSEAFHLQPKLLSRRNLKNFPRSCFVGHCSRVTASMGRSTVSRRSLTPLSSASSSRHGGEAGGRVDDEVKYSAASNDSWGRKGLYLSALFSRRPSATPDDFKALTTMEATIDSVQQTDATETGTFRAWRENLLKISNVASMLCVIDCTVLPLVTLALPLFGMAASPAQAHWLHELGHSVAIFFVLPVGGLAATMNFITHRKPQISSIALLGLTLIYGANAGRHAPLVSRLPHELVHSLQCGSALHRTVNIVGCALLLGSNYISRRVSGCAHPHHNHNHGHSSKKSCNHDHS